MLLGRALVLLVDNECEIARFLIPHADCSIQSKTLFGVYPTTHVTGIVEVREAGCAANFSLIC